ncbi:sulfotransferase [Leisingera aquaemixtae]|uniref:sulfotransferase n=1 Tax=Leisingera aquaemixtae TaxID=1396826 RepID=UPI001C97CF19|nr:sulfotransferase [Leisingera aquaemixtae]MBY6069561.1 sulfotransferase [Leisingera aquaemixtae]
MATVVILLSDKRSGSTMFQNEICRHPAVETAAYSPHRYLETHWWLMSAVLLDLPGPLFAVRKRYDGYGSRNNARALMVDLLARCAPGFAPPAEDRALVFEGWEALCQSSPAPVFFEKSPQILAQWAALTLMLEWIEQTDFTVKIVGLVRNPHGVMYSAARLFGTDPETRQLAWLNGCRNLLAIEQMLPEGSYMRVRYEDLTASPEAGFGGVARFIGIAPDGAMGSGTRAGPEQKWKNDAGYLLELHPAVRQMAQHFGYSGADLDNPKDPAQGAPQAYRRRTFRFGVNRLRDRLVQPALIQIRNAVRRGRAGGGSLNKNSEDTK